MPCSTCGAKSNHHPGGTNCMKWQVEHPVETRKHTNYCKGEELKVNLCNKCLWTSDDIILYVNSLSEKNIHFVHILVKPDRPKIMLTFKNDFINKDHELEVHLLPQDFYDIFSASKLAGYLADKKLNSHLITFAKEHNDFTTCEHLQKLLPSDMVTFDYEQQLRSWIESRKYIGFYDEHKHSSILNKIATKRLTQ
jgi:hypothetical protein